MSTPSIDEIQKTTNKLEEGIRWLAEVLRGKNWVKKLLLLDVVLFSIFNPLLFPQILKFFGIKLDPLPPLYILIFWLVIGFIFIIALIVAIRSIPRKASAPTIELDRRSPIKGLRSFGFEDAEIFARLQRQTSIREFAESIAARDFRFGVICGESGCGKSSFLQAGLLPRLKDQCQCVYVKFTDLDPLDLIRQALLEQAQLPHASAGGADLLALFEAALQANNKPLVLFFDQFEQFFVHRKIKEQREPFILALANWYKQRPAPPVKIVISIRGDFKYRLDEFQKAMGYSLGPQDSFTLEKFTPHEAAEIFRVIAETEGIACDADFVKEIAEQQLAHEDGLISPVDIQILARMIWGQKTAQERAFNRQAFQQLGGIEGLLERYLSRVLDARETEERRQNAIKVLLALTDLERNVRAGVLTIESLKNKLAGTVPESELMETVQWLVRGDVRLITPSKLGKDDGYELAHERLIPALRKITGTVLSQVDQANQLLNRRVNEWLGNDKHSRYLLRWRELRKINKQKNFLTWGENEAAKKALVAQSQRQKIKQLSAIAGLFILFMILLIMRPTILSKLAERERNQRFEKLKTQFVKVPGGAFDMGDVWGDSPEVLDKDDFVSIYGTGTEKPVHQVILSDFTMSQCEITNQQYCDFLNSLDTAALKKIDSWLNIYSDRCHIKKIAANQFKVNFGFEEHPVATMTWYGAVAFCNYLSKRFLFRPCYNDTINWTCDSTANGYRLPTEAEWEYAARERGKKVRFGNGKDIADPAEINFDGSKAYKTNYSVAGVYRGETTPVASFAPNALGLYDMSGNVWEWCHDWYDQNYYNECYQQGIVKDPKGPTSSAVRARVLRGGSWNYDPRYARSTNRNRNDPDNRNNVWGFRVVQDSPH